MLFSWSHEGAPLLQSTEAEWRIHPGIGVILLLLECWLILVATVQQRMIPSIIPLGNICISPIAGSIVCICGSWLIWEKPEVFSIPKLKCSDFLLTINLKWENISQSLRFFIHMNSKRKGIPIVKQNIRENRERKIRDDSSEDLVATFSWGPLHGGPLYSGRSI